MKKKKSKGRPTVYKPEFCTILVDYFSYEHFTIKDMTITKSDGTIIDKTEREAAPPLFLSGAAKIIAEHVYPGELTRQIKFRASYRDTFNDWAKKFPDFSDALKTAKELEVERIRTNGHLGLYNCAFSIFTLKNIAGWRDTQEVKHSGEVEFALADKIKQARLRTNGKEEK